jgi:hypothetical protein
MKATVKPEFVGQVSGHYGLLTKDFVYEVKELGQLFEAVKAAKLPPVAKTPPVDNTNGGV